MAFRDLMDSVLQRLHQGPFGAKEDDYESNLPNGGRTGYIPPVSDGRRRTQQTGAHQRFTGEQTAWQQPAPENGWQQGAQPWTQQQAWNGQQPWGQQPWTQQQPGVNQQTGYQNRWQPAQQTPYESKFQRGPQQTGWQAPQATGWQTPQATGWQAAWQQPQQTAFQPQAQGQREAQPEQPAPPQMSQAPQQTGFAQNQQTGFGRQGGFAQNQQTGFGMNAQQTGFGQRAAVPDNITYMPGSYVGDDGMAYRHVERLAQPLSAATAYRLIEFMRNEETVIVNTELIRDERENQRCLDLLFGAAFTMNCTFTRISAKSIYLIAPRSVTVMPYESLRQMNEKDAAMRWPGAQSPRTATPEPQRERRAEAPERPLRMARYANA